MRIEIKVPDLGDGIDQVEVAAVEVAVGESVDNDAILVTLESDKAAMDIPADAQGSVVELLVKVGDKLVKDDLIAVIESAGSSEQPVAEPEQAAPDQVTEKVAPVAVAGAAAIQALICPALGDGIDGAEVAALEVAVGDTVGEDDTLITLETDKAAMDLPAGFAGKVVAIKVKVGDKVTDGDLLAEIAIAASSADSAVTAAAQPAVEQPVAEPLAAPSKPAEPPGASAAPVATTSASSAHASPAIRQFARELGADLAAVKGSGRKNRITRQDVTAYVKNALQNSAGGNAGGAGLQPLPSYDHSRWGEVESVKLSRIRQLTAKNLSRSWPQIPQVTQFDEADITELEAFRQAQKGLAEQRGTRLTLLALVIKAVATSLKNYPDFNSSLADGGEQLILKKYFHIGVAVDTPNGLVVPVVRDVDQKGIFDIAADLGELSALARDRKLTPDQMQGSSFTISSLGGIGGTAFTPVVNHPNVAILGLSRSAMKPVWDGAEFQPRLMLPLSLSYDHRVIDGAVAARFGRDLAENLQDLRRVLL